MLKYQKRYVNEENRKSLVNALPVYVQLQGEKGYPHKGTLDFAANLLSTSTGSLQLRAEIPNDKLELLPGLYGKVLAEYGEKRQAVLIPGRAVQTDQQGDYIFVMDGNKKVERRAIKMGQRFDSLVEIVQGLKDSEIFVLNGFINVSTGQTVDPETATVAPLPAR